MESCFTTFPDKFLEVLHFKSYFWFSPLCLELHEDEGSTKWLPRSVFCSLHKVCIQSKTLSTDRNFTGKATATQLTNTSYQCQWLQDTYVSIQLSVMLGTVSEWKFTELNVSCYPYELTNFLTAKQNFESHFFEALSLILSDSCWKRLPVRQQHVHMQIWDTYVAN